MKIAVMQPYFFPYLGYFQLINAVDTFVIYDNVQFTKKGWFNRNRLSFNNKVDYFTINIAKDSDFLDVCERKISPFYFKKEMPKILGKIEHNYNKAKYFNEVYPVIKKCFEYQTANLYEYVHYSLLNILDYLNLQTNIISSSDLQLNHDLKNKDRIFDIYKHLKADCYINPSGGHSLYNKEEFKENEVNLMFLEQNLPEYKQLNDAFEPGLSIIDVMMFNNKTEISEMLNTYKIK